MQAYARDLLVRQVVEIRPHSGSQPLAFLLTDQGLWSRKQLQAQQKVAHAVKDLFRLSLMRSSMFRKTIWHYV